MSDPPVLKRLGQNFLSDPSILARIATSLELSGDECVLEIGAGRGALTEQLAQRCRRLVAIELDRMLVPILVERFASRSNVKIVEADALASPLYEHVGEAFKLAGNVPYYITTPLIFHALRPPRPTLSVFLIQQEVADRAAAVAGSDAYGALSVNLQTLARVEVLFTVPPGAFAPRPRVDSALIRLRPLDAPLVAPGDEEGFRSFVQMVFSQRRKQMQRILRGTARLSAPEAARVLESCGLDPSARPETLTPAEFIRLHGVVKGEG